MTNLWFRSLRPNPAAQLRLFCFPYAGGGASIYRLWPAALPATVEVYSVQLPGREVRLREPAFTQMDQLVETLAPIIYPYLDKPFAFFGHSMGALISFALARHVRRLYGREPVRLLLSGRRAPHLPERLPPIHMLPERPFLEALQQRYRGQIDLLWEHEELRALLLPLLRADLTLVETYQYQDDAPFTAPVTAFGGQADMNVPQVDLAAWRNQTQGTFTLQLFEGDHFYLNKQPQPLLQAITQQLATSHLPKLSAHE